nr:hypothetical protein [Salmonid herpesvirus 1]
MVTFDDEKLTGGTSRVLSPCCFTVYVIFIMIIVTAIPFIIFFDRVPKTKEVQALHGIKTTFTWIGPQVTLRVDGLYTIKSGFPTCHIKQSGEVTTGGKFPVSCDRVQGSYYKNSHMYTMDTFPETTEGLTVGNYSLMCAQGGSTIVQVRNSPGEPVRVLTDEDFRPHMTAEEEAVELDREWTANDTQRIMRMKPYMNNLRWPKVEEALKELQLAGNKRYGLKYNTVPENDNVWMHAHYKKVQAGPNAPQGLAVTKVVFVSDRAMNNTNLGFVCSPVNCGSPNAPCPELVIESNCEDRPVVHMTAKAPKAGNFTWANVEVKCGSVPMESNMGKHYIRPRETFLMIVNSVPIPHE